MIVLLYLVSFHFAVKTRENNKNEEDLQFKELCKPNFEKLQSRFDNIKNACYLSEERVTQKVLKLSEEERKKYGMTNDVFEYAESILLQNVNNLNFKLTC